MVERGWLILFPLFQGGLPDPWGKLADYGLGGLVMLAMGTALVVLWRRNLALADERARRADEHEKLLIGMKDDNVKLIRDVTVAMSDISGATEKLADALNARMTQMEQRMEVRDAVQDALRHKKEARA